MKREFILIICALLICIFVAELFLHKNEAPHEYIGIINKVFSSSVEGASVMLFTASKIDIEVSGTGSTLYSPLEDWSNKKTISTFTSRDNPTKFEQVKTLLLHLKELPIIGEQKPTFIEQSKDGYYLIRPNIQIKNNSFFRAKTKTYKLDLFYDISNNNFYLRKKYLDMFDTNNNGLEMTEFKGDQTSRELIAKIYGKY